MECREESVWSVLVYCAVAACALRTFSSCFSNYNGNDSGLGVLTWICCSVSVCLDKNLLCNVRGHLDNCRCLGYSSAFLLSGHVWNYVASGRDKKQAELVRCGSPCHVKLKSLIETGTRLQNN